MWQAFAKRELDHDEPSRPSLGVYLRHLRWLLACDERKSDRKQWQSESWQRQSNGRAVTGGNRPTAAFRSLRSALLPGVRRGARTFSWSFRCRELVWTL